MNSTFARWLGIAALSAMIPAHALDCDSQKNESETLSCLGDELRDSDQRINLVYGQLMTVRDADGKAELKQEQREWLRERDHACHLNPAISSRKAWIEDILGDPLKTICVVHFTRSRIAVLEGMQTPAAAPVAVAPAVAPAPPPHDYGIAFDKRPATVHSSGKWYFEIALDYASILKIMPTVFAVGLSDKEHLTGTMENIRSQDASRDSLRLGIAADLDNGKLYISKNGAWIDGVPGSNQGTDLKLGRDYYASFLVSATEANQQYLATGAIAPNFGDQPMAYALPDGYSPWRSPLPK